MSNADYNNLQEDAPINLEIKASSSLIPDHNREDTQLLGGLKIDESLSDHKHSKQSNRNVIRVNNKIGAATIKTNKQESDID